MATEFDATKEVNPSFGGKGTPEYAEHSRKSSSKKVISGPMWVKEHASGLRTIDPIHSATPATLSLLRNKAYRVASSVACYFRMSLGASAAAPGDIYLPADTPTVVTTDRFDTLSAVAVSAAGIIQAVEVE